MKIGIFGLTADPCTIAHYAIVKKVLSDKLVDKVIVAPTIVDYYRKDKTVLFNYAERRQILEKFFNGMDDVILYFNDYSIANANMPNLASKRRYIDMLYDVIKLYGIINSYYTIIGEDSYNNFKTWKNWENILQSSKLIVVKRDVSSSYARLDSEIEHISVSIDERFFNVSSSGVRASLIDDVNGMSMGPNATPLNLYLDDIDCFKRNEIETNTQKEETMENNKIIYKDKNGDQLIASTPIFDVVKAPEVEAGFRPVKVKSKDWVMIVVEDSKGNFMMETQLRHGLNQEFEEFPCGMVEEGEYPMDAAIRELKEETGIEPKRFTMQYLGKYAANPAFMTNYMHYFYIKLDKYEQGKTNFDEHEHITSYWKQKKDAFKAFYESDGSVIEGNMWMLLIKNGILNEWDD